MLGRENNGVFEYLRKVESTVKIIFKLLQAIGIQKSGDFDRSSLEGHSFEFQELPEVGHKLVALDLNNGRTLSTTTIRDIRADRDKVWIITKNTSYLFSKVAAPERV